MTTVQIERPEHTKLADWFAELRLWLDNNDCSPMRFSQAGQAMSGERFNITFADEIHAESFVSAFAKYRPSIRRPIGGVEPGGDPQSTAVPAEIIDEIL